MMVAGYYTTHTYNGAQCVSLLFSHQKGGFLLHFFLPLDKKIRGNIVGALQTLLYSVLSFVTNLSHTPSGGLPCVLPYCNHHIHE